MVEKVEQKLKIEISIPVDKISESKRIMTQKDCGDWINGKKKWTDFPEVNNFSIEEFEKLKIENKNHEGLIKSLSIECESLKQANQTIRETFVEVRKYNEQKKE